MLASEILSIIIQAVGALLGVLMLVRVWTRFVGMPSRNPMAQVAYTLTDWLVKPLSRVLPSRGRIDWAALLGAYLFALAVVILTRIAFGVGVDWDLALLGALKRVIDWALTMVIWATIIYVVLSWVNPQAPVAPAMSMLLRPLLDPIRRILPAMGGLDLSPMVLGLLAFVAQRIVDSLI